MSEKVIGSGTFGSVHRGKYKSSRKVAIKVFYRPLQSIDKNYLQIAMKEFDLMSKVKHRNVIRLYGFVQVHTKLFLALAMEYANKGSLKKYIHNEAFRYYFSQQLKTLMDVAEGMRFIHIHNILHRDLKPENVLMFKDEDSDKLLAKISETKVITFSRYSEY